MHSHDHHHHPVVHLGAFFVRFCLEWGLWIAGAVLALSFVFSHPWFSAFIATGTSLGLAYRWWTVYRYAHQAEYTRKLMRGLERNGVK